MSNEASNLPSDQDATGRSLGDTELAYLGEALRSGTLTSTKGTWVNRFERSFSELVGVRHAFACSSGTAAIHIALSALGLEPGDEVITTPITDMGAIAPILYHGAIPVFADVDRKTLNITPETARERLTERTRAIVATHLFGSPCDLEGFARLADNSGVDLIEDCAQAFLAGSRGHRAGTVGRIGCFSLQQGKHITTGEGGVVVTNDDTLSRHLYLAINKGWGYGDVEPDHYFLALNFRLSELQGAVATAQLAKLEAAVQQRIEMANYLNDLLAEVPGLSLPRPLEGDVHAYWRYAVRVDPAVINEGAVGLGGFMRQYGIANTPRYIQKPAYQCAVLAEQRTFGNSRWPFTLAHPDAINYDDALFPGVIDGLRNVLVLPWNERYERRHIDHIADVVAKGVKELSKVFVN